MQQFMLETGLINQTVYFFSIGSRLNDSIPKNKIETKIKIHYRRFKALIVYFYLDNRL